MTLRDIIQKSPLLLRVARKSLQVLRQVRALVTTREPDGSVSTNYQKLEDGDIETEAKRLRASWQDDSLPERQRSLADKQLARFRAGNPVDVFDVFVQALKHMQGLRPLSSLLEIGCSSGYYSEVMQIAGLPLAYTGCDYSEALIRLARERHPHVAFAVEDATKLSYDDSAFDIVVSGCCLQHIPEYDAAIAESARVSRFAVIFHRTPVLENAPTEFFRKDAYGVETFEIHFSETELLHLFARNGLTVDRTIDLSRERLACGAVKAVRTYICTMNGS